MPEKIATTDAGAPVPSPDDVARGLAHPLHQRRLQRGQQADPAGERVAPRQPRAGQPGAADLARRRRQERHARHPLLDQLRVLLGQRHDRHPAHGVPDEHQRALGGERADDGVEVVAELLDRAALAGGALGAAVAALVVEHHAHAGVGEGGEEGPLEVPGAPVEREPVHETTVSAGSSAASISSHDRRTPSSATPSSGSPSGASLVSESWVASRRRSAAIFACCRAATPTTTPVAAAPSAPASTPQPGCFHRGGPDVACAVTRSPCTPVTTS